MTKQNEIKEQEVDDDAFQGDGKLKLKPKPKPKTKPKLKTKPKTKKIEQLKNDNDNDNDNNNDNDLTVSLVCSTCLFSEMYCICEPHWYYFDYSFKNMKTFPVVIKPLEISTITFNFRLKNVRIDLTKLIENFQQTDIMCSISYERQGRKCKDNSQINNQMYNCCSIRGFVPYPTSDSKQYIRLNAKIFCNGSINLLGGRSLASCVFYTHELMHYFVKLPNYDQIFIQNFCYESKSTANISLVQLMFSKKSCQKTFSTVKKIYLDNNEGPCEYSSNSKSFVFRKVKWVKLILDNNIKEFFTIPSVHIIGIEAGDMVKYYDNCDVIQLFDAKVSMVNTDFQLCQPIKMQVCTELLQNDQFSYFTGGPIRSCVLDLEKKYHAIVIQFINRSLHHHHQINNNNNNEHEHQHEQEEIIIHRTRKGMEKLRGTLTISIFGSGKIIITGGQNALDILNAYYFLVDFFNKNHEMIFCDNDNNNNNTIPKTKTTKTIKATKATKTKIRGRTYYTVDDIIAEKKVYWTAKVKKLNDFI